MMQRDNIICLILLRMESTHAKHLERAIAASEKRKEQQQRQQLNKMPSVSMYNAH